MSDSDDRAAAAAHKPCPKCGSSDRYNDGHCKPCTRERRRKLYAENPERFKEEARKWKALNRPNYEAERYAANRERQRAKSKRWRSENTEKQSAMDARYYAANAEKKRAYHRQWARDNPETAKAHRGNRRARRLNQGGVLSTGLVERLLELQRGKCACCKARFPKDRTKNVHLDHIVPLSKGGTNTDGNMQLLCGPCNLTKHAKDPVEFMQSRGFLL